MRLSSFAIMAPLVSVLLTTTTLAVDTAETKNDNNNNTMSSTLDQQEPVETKQVSSLPIRRFPALWNFEVDDDFTETPELMAQMQEAFLLSANEVHNSADIKFLSTFIRGSIHEHLAEEEVSNKKKTMMMMMLDGEEDQEFEQGDYYYEVEEEEDEPMDAANEHHTRGGKTRMLGKIVNRPSNKKFGPIFRPNYQSLNNVGCNLCSDDDDATSSMLASPLELGSAFYQLEDGRDIRLAWQRKFCQKLRSIPELEKARRCFIYFDLDHEEPVDNMDESSMVTLADI